MSRSLPPLHLACALGLVLAACGPGELARSWSDAERARILTLSDPGAFLAPADPTNRFAEDPRAARLGQRLFFDPALSRTGAISCATCHEPDKAFTDGKPVAHTLAPGPRNTPTVIGAGAGPWLFWDGRKDSLWAQALGPFENAIEMDFTRLQLVRALAARYRADYEPLFGPLPSDEQLARLPARGKPDPNDPSGADASAWNGVPAEEQELVLRAFVNAGKALGAYERLLTHQPAPFDRYVDDLRADRDRSDALSASALAGLRLFVGKAGCINCHAGPRFTDESFHNLGVPLREDEDLLDHGRGVGARRVLEDGFNCRSRFSDAAGRCAELEHLDPTFVDFDGAFRTPSLRGVTRTPPYMHNGAFAQLADVVDFYSRLPGQAAAGHRELTLQPLQLTADEQASLVAFLESLTGELPPETLRRAP